MSRGEKIEFILWAINEIEGVTLPKWQVAAWSNEQLDKEVEWCDYLLGK